MNDKNFNLGKTLFEIRTERGMSLREFSEYLKISHAYLSKLEKGADPRTGNEITPTIETLAKIAAGINLTLEELLDKCGYLKKLPKVETQASEAALPKKALNLNALINEFVSTALEAERVEYMGKRINPTKEELLKIMIDELGLMLRE